MYTPTHTSLFISGPIVVERGTRDSVVIVEKEKKKRQQTKKRAGKEKKTGFC
jgi:hypothetical protein